MGGIFSLDGPVMAFLVKVADILTLSVLWIVCSIPIVTIGASSSALYTMTLRMVRGEEGKIVSGFWKAFIENFKQATVIHLFMIAAAVMIFLYGQVIKMLPESMQMMFQIASTLLFILWVMELLFVYPVQARFANTLFQTMKNAWLMAVTNIPVLLGVVVISGLPAWTILLNTELFVTTLPLWIFLAPGLIAWLNSFLFQKAFTKYIPEETNKMAEEV